MRLSTLALLAAAGLAQAEPFVFQGTLDEGGMPADGLYDFEFLLYDAESGGFQIGSVQSVDDLNVEEGSFLAELDFGNDAFDGTARWVEIRVRTGDSNDSYTLLNPRAKIGSAPQANFASKAGVADELANPFWTQAPGILQFGPDQGMDQVLINRNVAVQSTDVLMVHRPMNEPGGITMSTWANGMPYFGYASGGLARARTYYDPITDAWVVSKGGTDVIEVDQNDDVVITNNLIVNGTITSMGSGGGGSTMTGYKAYTPNSIFRDFEFQRAFNQNAGAIQISGSSGYLRIDLDLPHNAMITNINVQYLDQSAGSDLRFELWTRDLNQLTYTIDQLATSMGSAVGVFQNFDLVYDPPLLIDNTAATYAFRVFSTSGNWPAAGSMGIRSVLVEYELSIP